MIAEALKKHENYIKEQVLALYLEEKKGLNAPMKDELGDGTIEIDLRKV